MFIFNGEEYVKATLYTKHIQPFTILHLGTYSYNVDPDTHKICCKFTNKNGFTLMAIKFISTTEYH